MKRKKFVASICAAALMGAFVLSACSKGTSEVVSSHESSLSVEDIDIGDAEFGSIYAQHKIYETAESLIESADLVFIGKVASRSFEILDFKTALPPTELTAEDDKELCTIYTADVITLYKGDAENTVNIRTEGGIRDECLAEQLQVLKAIPSNIIMIMEDMPEIKIGEYYLFSLRVFEGTDPCVMNLEQSIIEIGEIDKASVKDRYGYISAKDIISAFGEEQWAAFESGGFITEE